MTDMEIYEWLYNLKPESMEQETKIRAMMRTMLISSTDNRVKEFLNTLNLDDVLYVPTREVYEKYCKWAKKNDCKKVAHNIFSEAVQNTFYVKSKVVRLNGKVTRVYNIIE